MWKWLLGCGVGACLLASSVAAQDKAGDKDKPKEAAKSADLPKCIMMTEETVDFNVKVMTATGPVYFCCTECVGTYNKEPAKHADKAKVQQAACKKLPRVQVNCPVEGAAIDKKAFIEKDGQKTYFCCDTCKGAYEKEPAKYAAALEGSYSYQMKCPVMGKTIDPASFVDLAGGQRVYMCCKMCSSKLTGDPAKYAPALASQGYNLDLDKIKGGAAKGETKDAPKPAPDKKDPKKDEKKP